MKAVGMILFQGLPYAYVRAIHGGHVFRPVPRGIEQFVDDSELRGIVESSSFSRLEPPFVGADATPVGIDATPSIDIGQAGTGMLQVPPDGCKTLGDPLLNSGREIDRSTTPWGDPHRD